MYFLSYKSTRLVWLDSKLETHEIKETEIFLYL